MKVIKYQLCAEVNHGTEDEPKIEQVFLRCHAGMERGQRKNCQDGSLQWRVHR